METKDEVFSLFQKFKTWVENQTRKKNKVLRSNNGGVYTSNDTMDFLKDVKIKREIIVSYNTQQNGVAEWKN